MASRDLRLLVEAGLLAAQGEKRGRSYVATPLLRCLRDETKQAVRIDEQVDPYAVRAEAAG